MYKSSYRETWKSSLFGAIVIAIAIALESFADFDSLFSMAVAVAAGLLFYLSTESLVWCIGLGLGTTKAPFFHRTTPPTPLAHPKTTMLRTLHATIEA